MGMRRTDLALEARELWRERAGETTRLSGVEAHEGTREGLQVTVVRVLDAEGERALGKPRGRYATLTLEGLERREGWRDPMKNRRPGRAPVEEPGELICRPGRWPRLRPR